MDDHVMSDHVRKLLQGAYDLHIHSAPDVRPRSVNDFELAERFTKAGLKGFAIKAHYAPTSDRAFLLGLKYPHLKVAGGVVLNSTVGGVNPIAVETAARLGGKFVWFPTVDAKHDIDRLKNNVPIMVDMELKLEKMGMKPFGITIFDDDGKLIPEVHFIIDIINEYNLIMVTAHLSHEEAFALVREGKKRGVKKMLVAHVDWKGTFYTVEEQREFIKLGAILEHAYATTFVPHEELCVQMKELGPEHFIISTDLGMVTLPAGKNTGFYTQGQAPYPDEGMALYVEILLKNGFSDQEIRKMIVENPEILLS
ncbi:MAG: DUF6282 family protein [Spirochaetes bacterium]|nr:DUF6282 family protein [Spirochaetota bacterium]